MFPWTPALLRSKNILQICNLKYLHLRNIKARKKFSTQNFLNKAVLWIMRIRMKGLVIFGTGRPN